MRYLKTYRIFEAKTSGLTQEQEKFLNQYTRGTWTYNPATGLVDVVGDFDCSSQKLQDLKGIRFGSVSMDFFCKGNELRSLEGAPREVGGELFCDQNEFTSLEGAPEEVGGKFSCDAFELDEKEWNLESFLKVQREGKRKAQRLIMTLLTPEFLNREIQKDPAGTIMKLKHIWNDEIFKDIKSVLVWPKEYENEADLVGGLGHLGF